MKIKRFNEDNIKPQVGDYVIVNVNYFDIKNFVNASVGKLVDEVRVQNLIAAKIKYDNIPENLKKFFDNNGVKTFHLSDIKYFSKNKKEMEQKVASKKYNL